MTISQRKGVCRMSTDPMYREMVKLTKIMTMIDKRLKGIEEELRTANMALNREAEKGDGQNVRLVQEDLRDIQTDL